MSVVIKAAFLPRNRTNAFLASAHIGSTGNAGASSWHCSILKQSLSTARKLDTYSKNLRRRNGVSSKSARPFSKINGPITTVTSADPSIVDSHEKPISASTLPTSTTPATSHSMLAYADLAKAKLSALVVTTTAAGFMAAGCPLATHWDVLLGCITGTALCSSSAAAWNQIFEIERDRLMKRTHMRPLVQGRLTVHQAMWAASLWGITGTGVLAMCTDPVTTALGVSNMGLYAGVYTYLKQHSIYNTWVGAVVGAIPPVMGWTAATGGHVWDVNALLLGATLYWWQMPHFFALSYMHRLDYARGGFVMLPVVEKDGERTANVMVRYAWYLSSVPFIATLTGVTSSMFAMEGVGLNAYALYVVYKFKHERTNANARKVFLTSLWYLPSLLMLFLLHAKVWDEETEPADSVHTYLADRVHWIRGKGRDLCLHEKAVLFTSSTSATSDDTTTSPPTTHEGSKLCPIVVGASESRKGVEAASLLVATTADTVVTASHDAPIES
jgi:heme o synthase